MPQLQKFHKAGYTQYADSNNPGPAASKKEKSEQTPENHIEDTAERIVHPVLEGSRIEFAKDADYCNDNQREKHPSMSF